MSTTHKTEEDGTITADAGGTFPYVVIRYIPGVYGRIALAFGVGATDCAGVLAIDAPVPAGPPFSPEVRARIVERTAAFVKQHGFRCCAVFGPQDAVYVEPDGAVQASTLPPSGGVRLDRVDNTPTGAPRAIDAQQAGGAQADGQQPDAQEVVAALARRTLRDDDEPRLGNRRAFHERNAKETADSVWVALSFDPPRSHDRGERRKHLDDAQLAIASTAVARAAAKFVYPVSAHAWHISEHYYQVQLSCLGDTAPMLAALTQALIDTPDAVDGLPIPFKHGIGTGPDQAESALRPMPKEVVQ